MKLEINVFAAFNKKQKLSTVHFLTDQCNIKRRSRSSILSQENQILQLFENLAFNTVLTHLLQSQKFIITSNLFKAVDFYIL